MAATVLVIRSVDGNLELALGPATIALRLSPKAAKEFDAACEAQKAAGWFPLWRQIKAAMVSAAQQMSHHFADTVKTIPLETVTAVTCTEGRLQVLTAGGNQFTGAMKIELGTYQLDCQFDAPGLFAPADITAFAARVAAVKPLYLAYLAQVQARA